MRTAAARCRASRIAVSHREGCPFHETESPASVQTDTCEKFGHHIHTERRQTLRRSPSARSPGASWRPSLAARGRLGLGERWRFRLLDEQFQGGGRIEVPDAHRWPRRSSRTFLDVSGAFTRGHRRRQAAASPDDRSADLTPRDRYQPRHRHPRRVTVYSSPIRRRG